MTIHRFLTTALLHTVLLNPVLAPAAEASAPSSKPTRPKVHIPGWTLKKFYTLGRLGANGFGFRPDGSLFVVGEWGPMAKGLYWGREGDTWDMSDAFSVGRSYADPEAVLELPDGIYVTDNQIPGKLLIVSHLGGDPTVFSESGIVNPYDVIVVPDDFRGPNVKPGDLLVFDNAHGNASETAIWVVNRTTGDVQPLIRGNVLDEGFLSGSFGPDGTLYAGLNDDKRDGASILAISVNGRSRVVLGNFCTRGSSGEPRRVSIAVHPVTGEIFFSADRETYAFLPGSTPPRLVLTNGGPLRWSHDGSRLFSIAGGAIWTLTGPEICSKPVSADH